MNDNRGRPLPVAIIKQIRRLREHNSVRETARLSGTSVRTVLKYSKKSTV
jgi:DNA invertase Pin-like site-specific DNA recombinase